MAKEKPPKSRVGERVIFNDVVAAMEEPPLEGSVTSGPTEHGYCDVRHDRGGSIIRSVSQLIFKADLN